MAASERLVKNSTSYKVQSDAFVRTIHNEFIKNPNMDAPWSSMLKYYQYLVRRYFTDPEFNIGGANGRGLLVFHQMGSGKTRTAVAIAMSLWDVYEPLVLLPKSLRTNFEKTVAGVVRMLNKDKGPDDVSRAVKQALRRFHFLSTNAGNIGTKIAGTKLRKRIIIVDEAHNLFRAIINGGKNAQGVYKAIMQEPDIRVLFLTGTPCSKDPFEMVPCFNMIMGYEILPTQYENFTEFFVDRDKFTIKNAGVLSNRLFGLVSYTSMETNKEEYRKHFPELLPRKVERVQMTQGQYSKYLLARTREREETTDQPRKEIIIHKPLTMPSSESSFGTYYVASRMLSNFCDGDSPKFERIVSHIKTAKGPTIVYSQFVEAGGLQSLKTYLEKEKITYAEISGKVNSDVQRDSVIAFNSPENSHGEKIRTLLISKSGAEGLSLKRVRQVHIVEPYWDWSRIDQVEARAVRLGSHVDLPEEERNVQTFIYIAIPHKDSWLATKPKERESMTVDELFYTRALKKHSLNNDAREILKGISFECSILGLQNCRTCQPTDERLYTNDVRKDIRGIDPCNKIEEAEVDVQKLTHEGTDYFYRKSNSLLGYEFYKYNDSVKALLTLDPGDPVIIDLLDIISPFQM